jgi:pimeloyl-ACP methyl ester carboxylesterase
VNAPRLVLLPGLDGTGDLFDALIDALGREIPSTVVHYASPPLMRYAECRAAVMAQLPRDEPYILLGESFSGPVAVAIAASRPLGLCGLVLCASFITSPRRSLRRFRSFIRFMPLHGAPQWAANFVLCGKFGDAALRRRIAQTTAGVPQHVLRTRLQEVALVDASEHLRKVTVPILYLRATHDRLVPRSSADRIARLSPRVRIVDIEAPHLLLQCAPRESAQVITSFARECSSSRSAATTL